MRVWQKGTWDLFETLQLFATVPTTKPLHGQVESQCSFSISINNSFLIPYCQSYMNSVELKLKTHVIYLMEAIKKAKSLPEMFGTWNAPTPLALYNFWIAKWSYMYYWFFFVQQQFICTLPLNWLLTDWSKQNASNFFNVRHCHKCIPLLFCRFG